MTTAQPLQQQTIEQDAAPVEPPLLSKSRWTRLVIQATIVFELVVLTCCAFCWQGLDLFLPIRAAQDDRAMLSSPEALTLIDNMMSAQAPVDDTRPTRRLEANLILQLEDESLWHEYSNVLDKWIDENNFHKWPCWKSIPSAGVILGGPLLSEQSTQDEHSETRTISIKMVNKLLLLQSKSPAINNNNKIEILLYVPRSPDPFKIIDLDKESTAVTLDGENRLVTIVQGRGDAAVSEAMSFVMPLLSSHGLLLSGSNSNNNNSQLSFHDVDMWIKRVSQSTYTEARKKALWTREWLLTRPNTVPVIEDVVKQWMVTAKQIRPSQVYTDIALMERCIDELEEIRKHVTLMPPLVLQTDHFLAIFAPLLFPLLLPLTARMVKEYRRYKSLV